MNRVTITGADDNTPIEALVDLAEEFEFVEWGILCSLTRGVDNRYPSREWCHKLAERMSDEHNLAVSMHVCGAWARRMFNGQDFWLELPEVKWVAERIQVNGKPLGDASIAGLKLAAPAQCQYIFQMPRADNYILQARAGGLDAVGLFDQSGGGGIYEPRIWTGMNEEEYVGYAGGLGPDNVVESVHGIMTMRSKPFWIDMEGRVRDENDRLDLGKVRRVLELCAPLITD